MQRFKDVLGRQDERQNLRDVAFCILVVLVLVTVAFGLMNVKVDFGTRPAATGVTPEAPY